VLRLWGEDVSRTTREKPHKWGTASVPSWFKRMNRREERAKQEHALRTGKELPVFRTRDAYEYW